MKEVRTRDFLSLDDLDPAELSSLIDNARTIKSSPEEWAMALAGKQIALIFEKPSTRTRISFEVAVTSMGGSAVVLRGDELQLGRGETIEDTGRVLGRYVDAVVIRTFGQDRLERLAEACPVPVVNALSDFSHPCQGLADLQTIAEKKGLFRGLTLTYVGDGNNVAHSLMFGGVKLGMEVRVACPSGYEPFPQVVDRCNEIAGETGGKVSVSADPNEAAIGANVLYTDVWTSMGQEAQKGDRENAFEGFQINYELIDRAADDVLVMHCLPAHRGQEISADAIDGPHSVVWDQAENRLHAQKALLAWLLPSVA
jgi:ornithine carbamoyltransferase